MTRVIEPTPGPAGGADPICARAPLSAESALDADLSGVVSGGAGPGHQLPEQA
ncbi:MAG: hypothetical protein IH606_24325 [Burkholderiales bacterium]|nr:hypothetical protein [Burkholderiales bacterium]